MKHPLLHSPWLRHGARPLLGVLAVFALSFACGSGTRPGAPGNASSGGTMTNAGFAGDNGGSGNPFVAGGAGANGGSGANGGESAGVTAGSPNGGSVVGGGSAGSNLAGSTSAGAAGSLGIPEANRTRTVVAFDSGWLFNKGDAPGADQTAFADSSWRALSVPHDWSIEGPFDQNAPTTGRGAYLPAGIGWYRKHFTVPEALAGRRVFIEFDGVMTNSDVYLNGVHLGNHPYGYVGFRYEVTSSVKFGNADNVIAVKCDNSLQPASRYYTGAGIYRHVRLLATDPVHVDQWATFVTSPTVTTTSATVHVTTVVVNQGAAAANVTVQGVLRDPSGVALAPVVTTAKSVVPGKVGTAFTFDVSVNGPKLWDLTSPNLYSLSTQVQVGGTTVDDDLTSFGIRTLVFDPTTGLSLNGKGLKLKGVALHEEVSGLGAAVPTRAWQRRFAALKALGVNAIRTSHNPFTPEVLELADRMGLLVVDEFFDTWVAHKYTDVGDFGTYFNKAAPAVTGSPAVPADIAGAGATWWQTEVTNVVMHDRNHPSVALWSAGNEIRDSLAVRTPILTKMVALCHELDSSRGVTQALFQAGTNGDVTGATRGILDVWGNNYSVPDCLNALGGTPKRAGVLTEMGHETSAWATIMSTPALTGEFIWTGVDYLGEAPLGWPTVGSPLGLIDRVGTINPDGYAFQKLWGAPLTSPPPAGTTAAKVVLAADHAALLTDPNDVTYVKATIVDASGKLVANSTAAVTFSVTGPGALVAVDSGSSTQESFRGNVRKAFNGVCFAVIQATGPGAITVTASAAGLASATTSVQASVGTFVPCSGTCD